MVREDGMHIIIHCHATAARCPGRLPLKLRLLEWNRAGFKARAMIYGVHHERLIVQAWMLPPIDTR
jgi:hypothetical protein